MGLLRFLRGNKSCLATGDTAGIFWEMTFEDSNAKVLYFLFSCLIIRNVDEISLRELSGFMLILMVSVTALRGLRAGTLPCQHDIILS